MHPLAALLRRAAGDPRPDGELLAAFLAGRDEAAFAEVVRRHAGLVWGACRRALPDPADAEDAFQATFLVLVRRAGRLTRAATVGPWLHRVAVWTARNLRRKNARRLSRRRELPDALPASSAPNPPCDLDALLLRLPERYRAALVLCHLGGLTHREAAARLGCAEGTVSSLVSRGLAKLRAKLAADPTPLLVAALAGAAPASLSAAAVKSAIALQLASLSAAASPAVASLVKGVLPMFWVKKATAAGMMALVLLVTTGVGVSVRQVPQAVAADRPAPRAAAAEPLKPNQSAVLEGVESRLHELTGLQKQLRESEAKVTKELEQLQVAVERARRERKTRKNATDSSLNIVVWQKTGKVEIGEYRGRERVWTATFDNVFQGNRPPNWKPVREYLARAKADPNGPWCVTIVTQSDNPPAQIRALEQACREAGFTIVFVMEGNIGFG